MLDKIGVDRAHLLDRGALAGRLGRLAPPVLDRRPEPRFRDDRNLVLTGCTSQNAKHLGGALGAGGHERRIRRMQPGPADLLGVCDALFAELVAVVVGVPAQLDVSHGHILPRACAC